MALTSNETSETKNDEVSSSSSDNKLPIEHQEAEHIDTPLSAINNEEQQQSSTSIASEPEEEFSSSGKSNIILSDEMNKENLDNNRKHQLKTRSVSFAPTVEEYEIPARSSFSSDCSTDFLDALVESYKLQTSVNLFPSGEEKKYVPKTTRTRLNPNWREVRIRRLMNKLEELSLWDREEELKVSQAQSLRDQKWEQIQDRQRNHDLCLNLMRQRHESEMESAVLLDQISNDENISTTIARTINLTSPDMALAYDLPMPPHSLKRRVRQEQEKISSFKTPIGRYRQFQANMDNKLEKINEKLQPDWQIMRAYNPYYKSIPSTVVPLFGETYATLLTVPDSYSSNRYNQYHYNVAPYLHQSSQHASSPDYETHLRSNSNRDVRVPLKDENNSDEDDDDHHHRQSRSSFSPPRRSTSSGSLYDYSKTREHSLIHSRQPISTSIHQRSLNDDLNALTYYSSETNRRSLQNIPESSSNDTSTKTRSSLMPTNNRVSFIDQNDDDEEESFHFNKSPRMIYQPAIRSLTLAS